MQFHPLAHLRVATATTCLVVVLVVHYIDRPLALAAAKLHLFRSVLTQDSVHLPVMVVLAIAGVIIGAGYLLKRTSIPKWATAAMLAGLALAWSYCLVTFALKPVFARAVPTALIDYGQYGFFWFRQNEAYGSFPSGHSDQAAAILSVFWSYYPAWRWAYAAAFILLACALIIGEWHFLGDIIAGGFIGAAAGQLMVRIWEVIRPGSRTASQQAR